MTLLGDASFAKAHFEHARSFLERTGLLRVVLFLYVCLLTCPVRYWPLQYGVDPTWRFALNYAPAHGYLLGRDYVYTCGPLLFLTFPLHVGSNLEYGLIFQACLWLALAAILGDIFFLGGFRILNLALFSSCISLACPLFWFESMGSENLMLAGALLLLVGFQLRGGWSRYISALLLIGLLPLFKITAGLIGFAAMIGFLTERVIERRKRALPEILLAVLPIIIACGGCLLLLRSKSAFLGFFRGSAELAGGFSAAMSLESAPHVELILAAEAAVVLMITLRLQATADRTLANFYAFLLVGPFLLSLKHGFVRDEGIHAVNYFCFIALALALLSLTIVLSRVGAVRFLVLLLVFGLIWQETVLNMRALVQSSGLETVRMLWGAMRFGKLRQSLDLSVATLPESLRIEPEVVKLIGRSPVASLSFDFTNLAAAGLQLALYPTVQRLTSYTPWLDRWNAGWIREKGPRFLVFDGKSIDERDLWAETPAMWLEIYRWYDTRFLGKRNLLLERRAAPRFEALETIGKLRLRLSGDMQIPRSNGAVFWTMKCGYSAKGVILKLLARVPSVTMSVHETGGEARGARRVIPEVLVSPVVGNYLPASLAQFAAVFQHVSNPGYSIDRAQFGGSGATSYTSDCEVEFLRAATTSGSRSTEY